MKKIFNVVSCVLFLVALSFVVVGCQGNPREAGMVVSDPTVIANSDGTSSVQADLLARGEKLTVITAPTTSVDVVKANLVKGNLVDFKVTYADKKEVVLVPEDAAKTFNVILSKGNSTRAQFDSMKYGPELSPDHGVAGNMVAAGWIYEKTKHTITVGDGRLVTKDMAGRPLHKPTKRYEETYKVAKDAAVYNVNTTDYSLSAVSDYASIPVTADYKYSTTSRQAVYVVFDKNYKEAKHAEVVAIYYFTPQSTSDGKPVWDVPTQSYLLKAMGTVPADESPTYAGQNYYDIVASGVSNDPYTRSTEPFEIVKDTFYFVGDNEVGVYLFNADTTTPHKKNGKLIMLDAGWPTSGYQYWKNIEAMGFDPRKISLILSTHGHSDHYGTMLELIHMIENAGGSVTLMGTKEDTVGLDVDPMGNVWNKTGALPASQTELRERTVFYEYGKDYDFGNFKFQVNLTLGHTPGTGSFIFRVKDPANGNKWGSFGYIGGYGFPERYPSASSGDLRLAFPYGLLWMQQMFSDTVEYVTPQHTNQFPIVEIYHGLKAYNNDPANKHHQLTMMDALTKGEFANYCEKRSSIGTDDFSDNMAFKGTSWYASIQTYGPFKPGRENGKINVQATLIDGGKVVHGFNSWQNKNAAIPLLANGIQIITDAWAHHPERFFVQVYIDVLDEYMGYIPKGFVQEDVAARRGDSGGKPGVNPPNPTATITYNGGPVESIRRYAAGSDVIPEVLRTTALAEAQANAILATISDKAGKTCTISLTRDSKIIVPADITQTFRNCQ